MGVHKETMDSQKSREGLGWRASYEGTQKAPNPLQTQMSQQPRKAGCDQCIRASGVRQGHLPGVEQGLPASGNFWKSHWSHLGIVRGGHGRDRNVNAGKGYLPLTLK